MRHLWREDYIPVVKRIPASLQRCAYPIQRKSLCATAPAEAIMSGCGGAASSAKDRQKEASLPAMLVAESKEHLPDVLKKELSMRQAIPASFNPSPLHRCLYRLPVQKAAQ